MLDTNSSLDHIDRCERIHKTVIDRDDHDRVIYEQDLTPVEYVLEYAGYMYRKSRKTKGMRIIQSYDYYLGCYVIYSASESNGVTTRYQFFVKE